MTFTIQSRHIEGTEFKTLARIVGTDRSVLGVDGAGPLVIEVYTRGGSSPILRKSMDQGSNGIIAPATGSGWTRPGVYNFEWFWTPADLLTESPPFAFKAPGTYRIVYAHQSTVYGVVKTIHLVTIE